MGSNGMFTEVDDNQTWNKIEEMAVHNSQYSRPRKATRGGKHEVDSVTQLGAQLRAHIDTINLKFEKAMARLEEASKSPKHHVNAMTASSSIPSGICENCGTLGHDPSECRGTNEQVNAFQAYKSGTPYSNYYNENTKFHPNLSYKSQNVQNPQTTYTPPPMRNQNQRPFYNQNQGYQNQSPYNQQNDQGFDVQKAVLQMQKNQQEFFTQMQKDSQAKETTINNILAHTKMLETQLTQLASSSSQRQKGQLPPQSNPPRHETVSAIHLRSGTRYEAPKKQVENEAVKASDKEEIVQNSKDGESSKEEISKKNEDKVKEKEPIVIRLPFPSRQAKPKFDDQLGKFMEIVKNLEVSIPFTELINHVLGLCEIHERHPHKEEVDPEA
ncbi:uncharacterized protein LOC141623420 isoform X1 [Silene latifolia]|uniref:uncharacterized protein LOC141623420 isoform X1 n=1 Tax=Silene latifolia TaxID=37657 RepID=UPI003D78343C